MDALIDYAMMRMKIEVIIGELGYLQTDILYLLDNLECAPGCSDLFHRLNYILEQGRMRHLLPIFKHVNRINREFERRTAYDRPDLDI